MTSREADAAVPEPAPIRSLPHDHRGVPIAAHVGRPPAQPVRIAEFDQRRLFLLTAERRCTICGWRVQRDELCWYFSWPPAIEHNRRAGWTLWDPTLEGAGHEECMVYSAVACPFLSAPEYERRTVQRRSDEVITEKGTERGDLVLAGAPEMVIGVRADSTMSVLVGGGIPQVVPFVMGAELRPRLAALIEAGDRDPGADDREFAELFARSDYEADIDGRQRRLMVELAAESGTLPTSRIGRNRPCLCESGAKFKHCCLPSVEAATKRSAAPDYRPRLILPGLD